MKVALFPTCLVDKIDRDIVADTITILKHFGISVLNPNKPSCCGQIAFNMGKWNDAKKLTDNWLKIYNDNYDYIIAPSGSCVHMIRENMKKIYRNENSSLISEIENISQKTYELVEFLYHILNVREIPSSFTGKVTYHASCHYHRGLNRKTEPKELLKTIKNLEFIEMEKEDLCCGFGGLFSLKMDKLSIEMAKRKAIYIEESRVEFVTTVDLSCLLNLGGILSRNGSKIKPIHISTIFADGL